MINNYSRLNVNAELSEIERTRLEGQILSAINTAKLYRKHKLTFFKLDDTNNLYYWASS